MCGICGIYHWTNDRNDLPDEKSVTQMVSTLRHRGPDEMRVYANGPVALGTARLSIIDLSPLASQPMILDEGDYVICFNGEIYNYIELRKELEKEGIVFNSVSDTEVLLRLYIQRGIACLDELRGMFAFAIWNRSTQTLFLARDRTGEKPLVYYYRNGIFAFASEIKALLTLPEIPQEIDPISLHYCLHYVNVPAPYSAFKHIRKLRPAEYMIVSPNALKTGRYWHPRFRKDNLIKDPREAEFELEQCLSETVRIMCRSDVPIGATLSGGLDSSAVVAMMNREIDNIDTFCVSSQIYENDPEFNAARSVAEKYHTRHHELTINQDHLVNVRDMIHSFDEPINSFVPLHAHSLAGFISQHVTVALTGNGGDELFGGYADHHHLYRLDKKLRLWNLLNKSGIGRLASLSPLPGIRKSHKKYTDLQKIPINRIAAEIRLNHAQAFCDEIYSSEMKSIIADCDPSLLLIESFDDYGASNLLDGFLFQQLMVGSQHSIVDIPDITSMTNSMEFRSPFLDVKMIELAMRIPGHMKIRQGHKSTGGKLILRKAMRDYLPHDILCMKKAGFGSSIPYRTWFLRDWSEYVEDKLKNPLLNQCGLFNIHKLQQMYDLAWAGKQAPLEMLWGIVMISQWLEEYF